MVSRAESRSLRSASRARHIPHPAGALAGRRQRGFFALSVFVFGIACFYIALTTLTRITPELARGQDFQNFPIVSNVASLIPDPVLPAAPGENSSFNRRINLLVIGVDKRPDQPDDAAGYNTDTIMVLTMDPVSKTISALSFPRDMVIDIKYPDGFVGQDRINTSYGVGFQDSNHSIAAGAKHLAADIESNFGIKIDNWIWMDFKGVEKLINTVGGVTVDIPEELAVYDWYYTDDDFTDPHYETFPPGLNQLNGYRAVAFGRYRNDSDLYRVKRQQLVLQSALAAVFSRKILDAAPTDLWDSYSTIVHHDIPLAEMISYLPLLKATGGTINLFSVGDPVNGVDTMLPYTAPSGAALLDWNRENVQYWINQAFTKSRYAKSTVEVQNGAGPAGIDDAEALAQYLRFDQYLPVVYIGPDVAVQPTSSILLYTENRRPMAEDIADWLGIPHSAIAVRPRLTATDPDIVIITGRSFDPAKLETPR